MLPDGSILDAQGGKALGITESETIKKGNFWNYSIERKHTIYLSNKAFTSREQLAFVMQHELGHVRIYNAGLSDIAGKALQLKSSAAKKYSELLDNVGHYHIQESGSRFLEINGWSGISASVPSDVFSAINYQMANERIWKLLQNTAFKISIK